MATSKLPVEWVPVPREVIDLARRHCREGNPLVVCNLRPDQRPQPSTPDEESWQRARAGSDEWFVDDSVKRFLRNIRPNTRVILLFQGYGLGVGTAIVQINSVFNPGGCSRLDFARPKGFGKIHGCLNFWAPFILAIVRVNPRSDAELFAVREKNGKAKRFISIVERFGVQTLLKE